MMIARTDNEEYKLFPLMITWILFWLSQARDLKLGKVRQVNQAYNTGKLKENQFD